MKAAIAYCSMTGHSKKIAKTIATALSIEAQNIKRKPAIAYADLLFLIGGVYSGKSHPKQLEFVRSLEPANAKKVVLVTSSALDKAGQDEVRQILVSNGIQVDKEEYRCRGNFLFIKMGHPNKAEIQGAVDFAKRMMQEEGK